MFYAAQGDGGHLQAKNSGLRGKQPADSLTQPPASRLGRKQISIFETASLCTVIIAQQRKTRLPQLGSAVLEHQSQPLRLQAAPDSAVTAC